MAKSKKPSVDRRGFFKSAAGAAALAAAAPVMEAQQEAQQPGPRSPRHAARAELRPPRQSSSHAMRATCVHRQRRGPSRVPARISWCK